ncbi:MULTISPECIES: hypothetical protein [Niastella]|uniref:Uncharacterized protein n=1 Tax=Niastella soli TaxID=2821487 RepID=A0ABS3YND7_9BACT|nr:hypothetical protein [Niastella soli]MBO9199398.1 hypothetical protein [Niastella soli]
MGFNVSGIVINKNFENNFEELQEQLGLELNYEKDIIFEEASSNFKDETICDIYYSEKGTLLFIGAEQCLERVGIDEGNTLIFVLHEISMAFSLHYYENGDCKRAFFDFNGERKLEEGEKLPAEENQTDGSAVIWNQLGVVLGKSFWSIEPGEKAMRYKIV